MANPNVFNHSKINKNLKSPLQKKVFLKIFENIDSTNNQAKKFVQKKEAEKKNNFSEQLIVFAADQQLAGRGRRGHSWLSDDPASIAVSFLMQTKKNIEQIPQITAAAALAVKETFDFFKLKTKIKWPNDILVKNKKICGILSELIFDIEKNAYVIIGCGINLNNTAFSSEIDKIASSYYLEKNKKIDKNIFLAKLIEKMNFYLINYLSGSREMIIATWKKELNLVGKKIDFNYKNKIFTGIIEDVLESGELLMLFDNGQQKKLQSLNTSLNYQSLHKYNNDSNEKGLRQ
jgi:BirA family biotin operon repressor/biotin-[acetyl-CoA-carboxylase] ligase